MEVYGYIYMVRNKINGKIYFGKTENDFKTRYSGNILKNTHNEHLKSSIKTYGIENFEINEQFDVAYNEDDLLDLEDMYMCIYNTLDRRYGYNKQRSGSKHKGSGRPNDETRQKISNAMKGKRDGEKNHMYGKKHNEQTKCKMSDSQKGEKNHNYGKPLSDETKHKLREANSKKVICVETKQVFESVRDASKWYQQETGAGRIAGNVSQCCKGKKKTAGKHPITGEPLRWMYYDEWLELNKAS